jgi:hypothetical protein
VAKKNNTPIFCAVKETQTVFNGYGAQETCDMLVQALIHPFMPAFAVCSDDIVWARFSAAVFSYKKERIGIISAVPSKLAYVSGPRPFRFNKDAHHRFLAHVIAYRRSHVKVTQDNLTRIQALGLLNTSAIIQNNGSAVGGFALQVLIDIERTYILVEVPDSVPSSTPERNVRAGYQRIKLPNYLVTLSSGSKPINAYTPFTARPHPSWPTISVSESNIQESVHL